MRVMGCWGRSSRKKKEIVVGVLSGDVCGCDVWWQNALCGRGVCDGRVACVNGAFSLGVKVVVPAR